MVGGFGIVTVRPPHIPIEQDPHRTIAILEQAIEVWEQEGWTYGNWYISPERAKVITAQGEWSRPVTAGYCLIGGLNQAAVGYHQAFADENVVGMGMYPETVPAANVLRRCINTLDPLFARPHVLLKGPSDIWSWNDEQTSYASVKYMVISAIELLEEEIAQDE